MSRSPWSSAGSSLSSGHSFQSPFLEKSATAENWICYFPNLPYRRCWSNDKQDPAERADNPHGTKPQHPPAWAWLSCYCSPAGGRPTQRRYDVKTPRAVLDRISVLGARNGPAAPPPGSLYLKRLGARSRVNAETGQGTGAQRTRPSASLGLRVHHTTTCPKASGRCSPSVRPRSNRSSMRTTMPTMHCAGAGGGGGSAVLGHPLP